MLLNMKYARCLVTRWYQITLLLLLVAQVVGAQDSDLEDETAALKTAICVQMERLLEFKDDPEFQRVGFGKGGPYHKWMLSVNSLNSKVKPGMPAELRVAPDELEMLGIQYAQHGPENEHADWAVPTIGKTIGYDAYIANKRRLNLRAKLEQTRTWKDAAGKYSVKAKCTGLSDGIVTLEKSNGEQVRVPLEKLNTADQALLKTVYENEDLSK